MGEPIQDQYRNEAAIAKAILLSRAYQAKEVSLAWCWGSLSPEKENSISINENRFARFAISKNWDEFIEHCDIGLDLINQAKLGFSQSSLIKLIDQFAHDLEMISIGFTPKPNGAWSFEAANEFYQAQPNASQSA